MRQREGHGRAPLVILLVALTAALVAGGESVSLEQLRADSRAALDKGDFAAALARAKELNRRNPDNIAGYQLMAEAYLSMGDYDEADKALQWMLDLKIGKTDAHGWILLARFRDVTGDTEGALDALNMAMQRTGSGDLAEKCAVMIYSADLLRRSGRLPPAEKALAEVTKVAPDSFESLAALARIRRDQGRTQEASELFRKASERSADPRNMFELAEVTRSPADYLAFEKAARLVEGSTMNADRELVLFLAGRGKRTAEALQIAKRAADRRHDVFTLDALAVALMANNQRDEARKVMRRVLDVGVRDRTILEHASIMGVRPE